MTTVSNPAEKFLHRLDTSGGDDACWPWLKVNGEYGKGYFTVGIPGTRKTAIVVRLMMNPPSDIEVCHTCDNPPCCNPRHLFLDTHAVNMQDAGKKGRMPARGALNPRTRLTEDDVREIRRVAASGTRHRDIAMNYGLTRGAVSHLVRGFTWSHVV